MDIIILWYNSMRIFYFLIILILVYWVSSNVKLRHVDTLPNEQKKEIKARNRVRSMLVVNHLKQIDEPIMSASEMLEWIRLNKVDGSYKFNLANKPTQTYRHCKSDILNVLKENISSWNEKIKPNELKCTYFIEAGDEFVVTLMASVIYINKTMHLELVYYGSVEKSHEFLTGDYNKYYIQLVSIKPIHKADYDKKIPNDYTPFITMDTQIEYVNYINQNRK